MLPKGGHNVRATDASKAPCTSEAQCLVSIIANEVIAVPSRIGEVKMHSQRKSDFFIFVAAIVRVTGS